MQLLADRLRMLNIDWNERPLSEADLYRLCRRFRVKLIEMPLGVSGFYYRAGGRDFIAIDSRLSGIERLKVAFHELGHFLFHAPDSGATASFHRVGRRTRKEIEADVFAVCALIPRTELEAKTICELIDKGWPPDLVAERHRVLERYNI